MYANLLHSVDTFQNGADVSIVSRLNISSDGWITTANLLSSLCGLSPDSQSTSATLAFAPHDPDFTLHVS